MTNQNSSMLEEMKIKHVMVNKSLSIQNIKSKMPPLLLQSSHPFFFPSWFGLIFGVGVLVSLFVS